MSRSTTLPCARCGSRLHLMLVASYGRLLNCPTCARVPRRRRGPTWAQIVAGIHHFMGAPA